MHVNLRLNSIILKPVSIFSAIRIRGDINVEGNLAVGGSSAIFHDNAQQGKGSLYDIYSRS